MERTTQVQGGVSSSGSSVSSVIQPSDIIIPVMGETGAGKSTFIALCTQEPVGIGHGLQSFTADVSMHSFTYKGYVIRLIDTPGFDDTKVPDTQILKDIAFWLGQAYSSEPKILLSGIVYLHPIHVPRMQGTAKKNLEMFKEICGKDILPCVVLASTMWSKVPMQDAKKRQDLLISTPQLWGEMVQHGSKVFRHTNTRDSALAIIEHIIKKKREMPPIILKIQRQMGEGREVHETDAGQKLQGTILKEKEKVKDRLRRNEEELHENLRRQDHADNSHLLELQASYKEQISAKEKDLDSMKVNLEALRLEKAAQEAREEQAMERQREEHKAVMASLQAEMEEVRKNAQQAISTAEKQEQLQAALEKNNSALILQRDQSTGLELTRVQTLEMERRAAEMQAFEYKATMQAIERQMEERERNRVMYEQEWSRRLSARQTRISGAGLGIAALTFGFAIGCSVM